jgi:hypothetical protein
MTWRAISARPPPAPLLRDAAVQIVFVDQQTEEARHLAYLRRQRARQQVIAQVEPL